MMSLLIVDDEMRIADSLYAMIQDAFQERLAVRRCYSAAEAQALMEKTPVNILMTDINMPNTSGLELHRWVSKRWPMTRVIYLTGYSDFEYVREALDHHAQGYLLKSDGDERIVAAIEEAMRSIDEESGRLLAKAQAAQARPIFLRQLASRLVYGPGGAPETLQADLDRWNIGLDVSSPVLIGHCYFESQALGADVVIAIIEELAAGLVRLLVSDISPRRLLLLCQTGKQADINELAGLLEEAQRILETRGQRLTVALLQEPVPWAQLPSADAQLLECTHAAGLGPGELLRFSWDASRSARTVPEGGGEWEDALECMRNMHDYLMTGQRAAYFEEEDRLAYIGYRKYTPQLFSLIYSSIVMSLRAAAAGLSLPIDTRRLERTEFDASAETQTQARDALHATAEAIFDAKGARVNSRMLELMHQVNEYIQAHLADELSLTVLADQVHFHPVYLSRVYKDTMGQSLSDTIAQTRMDAACARLRESHETISEISRETGFSSANYFARWFKKRMGVTPQEYRDRRQ